MSIRKTCDLRQMRDAQNLMMLRQLAKFHSDHTAQSAADVGVDFIEDKHARAIGLRENSLQRQHDPRKLAARCDFAKRLRALAGIGLGDEFNVIEAGCRWLWRDFERDSELGF